MPSVSEAQRRYLNARFGHEWVKAHHFDNTGHLPAHKHKTGAYMAKLTARARRNLPASAFVFPESRSYPIHDANHARNALARAAGKPEEARVRAAVKRRYPSIK